MNGSRVKVRRLLSGPAVTVVVAGHRDRSGQMNTELAEAALAAHTAAWWYPAAPRSPAAWWVTWWGC